MRDKTQNNRTQVLRTLFWTTIGVLALLALAALLVKAVPLARHQLLETALETGNTVKARRLAEALDDDEQAQVLQRCCYLEAEALQREGQLQQAADRFAEAGSYADATDRHRQCSYDYAASLAESGQWDEAAETFRSLGGYRDAADRVIDCRYEKALLLLADERFQEAAELLDELGTYREAPSLLRQTAMSLTGLDDADQALAAFRGLNEKAVAEMAQRNKRRAELPVGVIDVGFYHTIGLGADGHVYACGDNSFGQCETGEWENVSAVAAGAWHSAALLSDGTVVCAGRNSEHQCDTSAWKDIVQIAAGDYATFGLCADGTVISTGYLDYDEISEWNKIGCICAGSYGVAAQREDGSLWFYPLMPGTDRLGRVVSLAVNSGYAVAACEDGSVVCTCLDLPWQQVLTVSASSTAILALDSEGRVMSHFFRDSDAVDFSGVTDAAAIAAGASHFAVVFSDGSVRVFGRSEEGQAETGAWQLAVN